MVRNLEFSKTCQSNLFNYVLPPQVKGVVFDIGNTLIPFDENKVIKTILPHTEENKFNNIFETIFRSGPHYSFLAGFIQPNEYFKEIRDEIGLKLPEKQFFKIYKQVFGEPNGKLIRFLKKSKNAGLRIGILSNLDIVLYLDLLKKYEWLKKVDYPAVSWRMKAIKPDHRFFDEIEIFLELEPNEIFYIDDCRANIEAAQIREWLAAQYIP